jgi:NitT/TauT family transport system ATP-binding protein
MQSRSSGAGHEASRRIESLAYPLHYTQRAVPNVRARAQDQMRPMHAAAPSLETRTNSAPALISARGLSKIYATASGEVTAIKNLDFEIYDGEFVSVVGQSGCGKSTLLKVLAGLLPYTAGAVELNGKPLRGPTPEAAVVFQSPVLLPWRTVLDNVLLPIEFRKLPVASHRKTAMDLLAMVGLSEFAQRYPFELSGGMQQRSAIVRALVQDPRLLLMDEPFGALDAMTREQMNLELMRIWSKSGKTVIFITHSIAEAIFLSDRVIAMTARPGTIADVITIDLPRPRDLSVINTERFGRYAAKLRSLLDAQGGMF